MIGIIDLMSQDKYVDPQNIDSIVIKYHAVYWGYPVKTVKSRFSFDKRFEQGELTGIKTLKKDIAVCRINKLTKTITT